MSDDDATPTVAPGPWTMKTYGRLLDDSGPACFRITASDGTRVCDLIVHPSVTGPGVAIARANAQWIIDHGPKEGQQHGRAPDTGREVPVRQVPDNAGGQGSLKL